jgi:hypothetical protein
MNFITYEIIGIELNASGSKLIKFIFFKNYKMINIIVATIVVGGDQK